MPVEGVDVYVTNKAVDGKTLAEWRNARRARCLPAEDHAGRDRNDDSHPAKHPDSRGDILTVVGRTQDTTAATKIAGRRRSADRRRRRRVHRRLRSSIGALIGAWSFKVGGVPMTLSTAGGALIAGIVGGWLRSVHPSFGRIPSPTVWFMNSVGLNIFIAIVGISAGPGFVNGLKTQGIGLFLWGALATTVPLILGMFIAKYVFRFHDALMLGIVSGARTTTASLGLVCDLGKSQVPALGYTVTYAVGNTLLTIWGMVFIMLLSKRLVSSTRRISERRIPWMTLKLKIRNPKPVRDQGLPRQARHEDRPGSIQLLSECRPWQPELDRHLPREGFFLLGRFASRRASG